MYGPYRPRPDASSATAAELTRWFASIAPDGRLRVDRLEEGERTLPARELFGRRTFFTDANGCIARAAWERVPFPAAAYAEDHALALAMLRAGYAKAFVPDAAVLHSHELAPARSCGGRSTSGAGCWRCTAGASRSRRGRSRRASVASCPRSGARGRAPAARPRLRLTSLSRQAGALAGSRADRLLAAVRGLLSLEQRRTYEPLADR